MSENKSIRLSILSLCVAGFFSLCGYEFLRSTSASLFQATFGVSQLPIAMASIPIVLVIALYFYNKSLTHMGARRTLLLSGIISFVILFACVVGLHFENRYATAIFYVFREVYIVLIIEQFWSFFNSSLKVAEAKKWTGILTGISSFGAILGGLAVHQLSQPLGTRNVAIIGLGAFLISIWFADLAIRLGGEPQAKSINEKPIKQDHVRGGGWIGAKLLIDTPVLSILFLLILTTQMMSTVLGLNFQNQLQVHYPSLDAQTAFSGSFYAALNGFSLFLQLIGVPLCLYFASPVFIQMTIPFAHAAAALYLLFHPTMGSAAAAFMLFKAIDYSLFRVSKEMLYMPLSFDARYRAKEFIDVFGYRFSKGATSLGIAFVQKFSLLTFSFYGAVSLVASFIWFILLLPVFLKSRTSASSVGDGIIVGDEKI